jgi:hypothetical protein
MFKDCENYPQIDLRLQSYAEDSPGPYRLQYGG